MLALALFVAESLSSLAPAAAQVGVPSVGPSPNYAPAKRREPERRQPGQFDWGNPEFHGLGDRLDNDRLGQPLTQQEHLILDQRSPLWDLDRTFDPERLEDLPEQTTLPEAETQPPASIDGVSFPELDTRQMRSLRIVEDALRVSDEAMREGIVEELRFQSSVPAWLKKETTVAGIEALADFQRPGAPAVEWDQLRDARSIAYLAAIQRGSEPQSVSYLSTEDLESVDPQEIAERFGVPPDLVKQIEVFPIGVGGQPVIRLPGDDDYRPWVVGGRPIPAIPAGALPAIGGATGNLIGAGGSRNRLDGHNFIRHGDDVGDPPAGALPSVAGTPTTSGNAPALPRNEPGRSLCGQGSDLSDCFLATVALHDRRRTYCSGALIAPQWVLTAAHCLCGAGPTRVTVGSDVPTTRRPAKSPHVTVSLGRQTIFLDDGFCETLRKKPEELDAFRLGDLALVELIRPLVSGTADLFAAIGTSSHADSLLGVEVAGFGARETDPRGGEKFVTSLAVMPDGCIAGSNPSDDARQRYDCVAGEEIVAIDLTPEGADSCFGDSGAPAYAKLENGRYAMVGLVSRGLTKECGPGGIYALVVTEKVRRWILSHAPDARLLDGPVALASDLSRDSN